MGRWGTRSTSVSLSQARVGRRCVEPGTLPPPSMMSAGVTPPASATPPRDSSIIKSQARAIARHSRSPSHTRHRPPTRRHPMIAYLSVPPSNARTPTPPWLQDPTSRTSSPATRPSLSAAAEGTLLPLSHPSPHTDTLTLQQDRSRRRRSLPLLRCTRPYHRRHRRKPRRRPRPAQGRVPGPCALHHRRDLRCPRRVRHHRRPARRRARRPHRLHGRRRAHPRAHRWRRHRERTGIVWGQVLGPGRRRERCALRTLSLSNATN